MLSLGGLDGDAVWLLSHLMGGGSSGTLDPLLNDRSRRGVGCSGATGTPDCHSCEDMPATLIAAGQDGGKVLAAPLEYDS